MRSAAFFSRSAFVAWPAASYPKVCRLSAVSWLALGHQRQMPGMFCGVLVPTRTTDKISPENILQLVDFGEKGELLGQAVWSVGLRG